MLLGCVALLLTSIGAAWVCLQGLVAVPINSAEYWEVHDQLRKTPTPNPLPQPQIDTQGDDSVDRNGMQDAWISSLHRVQNPQLYTYFDFQRRRLAKPDVLDGWHGTGDFDAANIYEDKQVGHSAISSLLLSRFFAILHTNLTSHSWTGRLHDAVF